MAGLDGLRAGIEGLGSVMADLKHEVKDLANRLEQGVSLNRRDMEALGGRAEHEWARSRHEESGLREGLDECKALLDGMNQNVLRLAGRLYFFESRARHELLASVAAVDHRIATLRRGFEEGQPVRLLRALSRIVAEAKDQGCPHLHAVASTLREELAEESAFARVAGLLEGTGFLTQQSEAAEELRAQLEREDSAGLDLGSLAHDVDSLESKVMRTDAAHGAPRLLDRDAEKVGAKYREQLLGAISREYTSGVDPESAAYQEKVAFLAGLLETLGLEMVPVMPGQQLDATIHDVRETVRRDLAVGDNVIVDVLSMGYREPKTGEIKPAEVVVNRHE